MNTSILGRRPGTQASLKPTADAVLKLITSAAAAAKKQADDWITTQRRNRSKRRAVSEAE